MSCQWLGRLAKLLKATINFVMSVCPSLLSAWNNSVPNGRIVAKFYAWKILENLSRKFKFRMQTDVHFWSHLAKLFLYKEIFRIKFVKKIKTHILRSVTFPRKSCRFLDNLAKYGTAGQATGDNITPRMRIACWIPKATDTHSEYVTFSAFLRQQWLRERASMLGYTYIVSCIKINWKNMWLFVSTAPSAAVIWSYWILGNVSMLKC
jgi:hypothetical protein